MEIEGIHGVFEPLYNDDDSEHWYLHKESGVQVPSVTTVTSILSKPWLVKWKIKEAVVNLVEQQGDGVSHKDFDRAVESAIAASEVKTKQAQIIGTFVHNSIEEYLDAWLLSGKKPERELVNYYEPDFIYDAATHLRYDVSQTQIIAALRSAQQLMDEFEFHPIAVEMCVGDTEHKYAGKLDLLCMVDGKPEIWDWKTSNMIPLTDPMYPMQINAYRVALEKMTGQTIHKQRIIQLSKSEDRFSMFEVMKSDELVDSFYNLTDFYEKIITNNQGYYSKVHRHK